MLAQRPTLRMLRFRDWEEVSEVIPRGRTPLRSEWDRGTLKLMDRGALTGCWGFRWRSTGPLVMPYPSNLRTGAGLGERGGYGDVLWDGRASMAGYQRSVRGTRCKEGCSDAPMGR